MVTPSPVKPSDVYSKYDIGDPLVVTIGEHVFKGYFVGVSKREYESESADFIYIIPDGSNEIMGFSFHQIGSLRNVKRNRALEHYGNDITIYSGFIVAHEYKKWGEQVNKVMSTYKKGDRVSFKNLDKEVSGTFVEITQVPDLEYYYVTIKNDQTGKNEKIAMHGITLSSIRKL